MHLVGCSSGLGKLFSTIRFGNAALTGMPLAVIYALWRPSKQLLGVNDRFDPQQAYQKYAAEGATENGRP
ncbi:MAG TPA: hypothetical protein DCY88_15115 [Cyanobacteria bacterium UBA11372]|nr:hypothetical protein [Cyanobacteria bacterium UBA11372]